jgi:hypothetical protein
MTEKTLDAAMAECKRFMDRARAFKKRIENDKCALVTGNKDGGAVRRASMDLTRALADMRRARRWCD